MENRDLTEEHVAAVQDAIITDYYTSKLISRDGMKYIKCCFLGILAIVMLMLSFSGASSVATGGQQLMEGIAYIEQQQIYSGIADFMRAFGIFSAGVFVWLGLKEFK